MKKLYFLLLLLPFATFAQIVQLKDIFPGVSSASPTTANSSTPINFFDFNGLLLFRANNAANGTELWKTNGTATGTQMVIDINTLSTTPNSNPDDFTLFQNKVYFRATTGTTAPGTGAELYQTDGTTAGTSLAFDLNPGTVSGNPINLTVINPTTMLFGANNGTTGPELFKIEGASATLNNVFDFTGTTNSVSWIQNLSGTAIIGYTVAGAGRELYKSSGVNGNCDLLLDINPGTTSGVGTVVYNALGNVFFQGITTTVGTELWKTNGTTAGTVLVKDIRVGAESSSPRNFATLGTNIYFSANGGTNGIELWKSDGTSAGTIEVLDLNVGAGNSSPESLTTLGSKMYYFAADNGTAFDLYAYDGTTNLKLLDLNGSGNGIVTNFVEIAGIVYFAIDSNADSKRELWQTNGTIAGTVPVFPLSALNANAVNINNITSSNGKLFFSAEESDGVELFMYTPLVLSNKNFELNAIKVYPNPSNGSITVDYNFNETAFYSVFDVLGKKVANGTIANKKINLDLNSGIYILKIQSGNESVNRKIIIN